MAESYPVAVGSGTLHIDEGVALEHSWTAAGVTIDAPFTGAHFLHLAVAGCVLNDVYREAERLGIRVRGVRVAAEGGFDDDWRSTGVRFSVAVDAEQGAEAVARLLETVDEVAEIPRALRQGAQVERVGDA